MPKTIAAWPTLRLSGPRTMPKPATRQIAIVPSAASPVSLHPTASPAKTPAAASQRDVRARCRSATQKQTSDARMDATSSPSQTMIFVSSSNALSSATRSPPSTAAGNDAPSSINRSRNNGGMRMPERWHEPQGENGWFPYGVPIDVA